MNTNKTNPLLKCERKEDLVAYLYEEATAAESASFERHLNECDGCAAELKAFGRVRDDLSTWQVAFAPRTELILPRSKMDVLRELIDMFPVWARGLALSGAAAAVVLLAMSVYGMRGGKSSAASDQAALSQQQVEAMVSNAVAAERARLESEYQAELASFKDQLAAEHKAQLQAVSAEHQSKLESVKASLRAEIKKSSRQGGSIRSFFAMEDERSDPWGDSR